jgi:hypothetical protein
MDDLVAAGFGTTFLVVGFLQRFHRDAVAWRVLLVVMLLYLPMWVMAIPADEPPPPLPVIQKSDEDMELDRDMEYLAEPEEALGPGFDDGI